MKPTSVEPMTPAEESPAVDRLPAEIPVPADESGVEETGLADEIGQAPVATAPPHDDPWAAIARIGGQLLSALATGATNGPSGRPASHPWISENPQTGERRLSIPLPPPETAQQIASALQEIAELLQARR